MELFSALAYAGGDPPAAAAPLSRFLPPVPEGMVAALLSGRAARGDWVLDPFGASPQLAVELARHGYRVLVAVNNPVTRFLLEMLAAPPARAELQSALAELAAAQKGSERVETHLQSIYHTPCTRCQRLVPAEAFIWERGGSAPIARIYQCPCGEAGEAPATEADRALAAEMESSARFHRPRALERVLPQGDPDRANVEEALTCYLPRAIYALLTLVNKLDGLSITPARRRLLEALLLSACDETNVLWSQPADRPRPRQLTIPPRFLEKNIWQALERAVDAWAGTEPPLPLTTFPELPPGGNGICIFEGPVRNLAPHLKALSPHVLLTAVPRPNQAFWTLSALWAGWLWGREAVTPIKTVLHRRRYDFNWHAAALYAALKNIAPALPSNVPFFALVTEAEPAFLTAVMLAASAAGFDLDGLALRARQDPVQLHWSKRTLALPAAASDPAEIQANMAFYLEQRGEAVPHLHLHAAGLVALAGERALTWQKDAISTLHAPLQAALASPGFIHHGGGAPESGLWASAAPPGENGSLPDKVEKFIVPHLQKHPGCTWKELESAVNHELRGLFTPSLGLVREVLASYGVESEGRWSLRPEDMPAARRADLETAAAQLAALGARLGYSATRQEKESRVLLWQEGGQVAFAFHLLASALAAAVIRGSIHPPDRCLLVLPGGRGGLLMAKIRRDPALEEAWNRGWRALKFRHLRQVAVDPQLDRAAWQRTLNEDPLEPPQQLQMF